MSRGLVAAFPMPNSAELDRAYTELFLAMHGDEETKSRIGNPAYLPRPWDPPTCNKPALRRELWNWLDEVVIWFNHEYVWDHNAGIIPACWPQHPHLVHEIAVLADQRRRAAMDPTSSSLEEWHRYGVPAFLDRLKARTKNGCDERHNAWPALGRFNRHLTEAARTERTSAFVADIEAIATPRVSESEPRPGRSRTKLRLIDKGSGRPIDPVTGQIL